MQIDGHRHQGERAAESSTPTPRLFDRPPPVDQMAEMALLGAVILEPTLMDDLVAGLGGEGAEGEGSGEAGGAGEDAGASDGEGEEARDQVDRAKVGLAKVGQSHVLRPVVAVRAEMFFVDAHRVIFEVLRRLWEKQQHSNLAMLTAELEDRKELQAVGGLQYLERLCAETPGAATAYYFARRVVSFHQRRMLVNTCSAIAFEAYTGGAGGIAGGGEDGGGGVGDSREDENGLGWMLIDRAEAEILKIGERCRGASSVLVSVGGAGGLIESELAVLQAAEDGRPSPDNGVRTGLVELDQLTGGFKPGEMIVLGARPSMGKTALGITCAIGAAARHGTVLVFSIEMSKEQIGQRLLAARSGVEMRKIQLARSEPGALTQEERRWVYEAGLELSGLDIRVDDTPQLRTSQMRSRARRVKRRVEQGRGGGGGGAGGAGVGGVGGAGVGEGGVAGEVKPRLAMVVIDYLQLLALGSDASIGGVHQAKYARAENRQVEVGLISASVKGLARELGVPVLVLAQLNRELERRGGGAGGFRPRLADLRESGSIEQDADVVMLLHREHHYRLQDEEWQRENPDGHRRAEVIVAKQRNGPTGVVELEYDAPSMRFMNMDRRRAPVSAWAAGTGYRGGAGGGGVAGGDPFASEDGGEGSGS